MQISKVSSEGILGVLDALVTHSILRGQWDSSLPSQYQSHSPGWQKSGPGNRVLSHRYLQTNNKVNTIWSYELEF